MEPSNESQDQLEEVNQSLETINRKIVPTGDNLSSVLREAATSNPSLPNRVID